LTNSSKLGEKRRCPWVKLSNPLYVDYHDKEWGVPVKDDRTLFEFLILEGAQAGLSWETILNKRAAYLKAFDNFEPERVATYDEKKIAELLQDEGIVRNKLKVRSAVTNAQAFLEVKKEFSSFSKYLWAFVDQKPLILRPKKMADFGVNNALSQEISKDLKKRGFKFVGPTIIYSYLQATGLIDEHSADCFRAV